MSGMSLPSCGQGGGVLFPYFYWLGGSGNVAGGDAPFYSARFLLFAVSGSSSWQDDIDME